ncbi:winged helix-turn-helix transcriptional regulator [Crossiella cryophila]|uniref:DNA-binding HxlR family transcriptional regulator n=1 Tax=Crossiella cryophila TaxID=43355 RepID=A0A7W7CGS8_9PSEU|nr:helix-turn-helix domain-containing protein [Crossiella cryophila]MBB4680936.1 DNA-binding HxlR family transcriptional regulator [Crossiella cryophila]
MEFDPNDRDCPTRQLLDRIGDQWTVLIVLSLRDGPRRFTEIGTWINGISQKVLSQTLRSLVRDGMLTRTAYAEVPPRVEYALTPLGHNLAETVTYLDRWAREHMGEVLAARAEFDQVKAAAR